MELPGYKMFEVMFMGKFYFPQADLTLERSVSDEKREFWAEVYRIGYYEWLIYYGERENGYTYIRFAHGANDALDIATAWIERHEV